MPLRWIVRVSGEGRPVDWNTIFYGTRLQAVNEATDNACLHRAQAGRTPVRLGVQGQKIIRASQPEME